jgi:hypothetical protein
LGRNAGGNIEDLFPETVFAEEKENIYKLLADSTNNIAWYTGGDVIIKYNGQIYSIQIKTATKGYEEGARIRAQIASSNLNKFINELLAAIDS